MCIIYVFDRECLNILLVKGALAELMLIFFCCCFICLHIFCFCREVVLLNRMTNPQNEEVT